MSEKKYGLPWGAFKSLAIRAFDHKQIAEFSDSKLRDHAIVCVNLVGDRDPLQSEVTDIGTIKAWIDLSAEWAESSLRQDRQIVTLKRILKIQKRVYKTQEQDNEDSLAEAEAKLEKAVAGLKKIDAINIDNGIYEILKDTFTAMKEKK